MARDKKSINEEFLRLYDIPEYGSIIKVLRRQYIFEKIIEEIRNVT